MMDDPFVEGSAGSDDDEESKASTTHGLLAEAPRLADVAPSEERSAQPPPKRSRKRETELYSSQRAAVRQEIAEVKASLENLPSTSADAHKTAMEVVELTKRIEFLRTKLEAHHRWMDDLQKLLASAPLMDFALRAAIPEGKDSPDMTEDESKEDTASSNSVEWSQNSERELSLLDAWRQDAAGKVFSSILIAKHVHTAVRMSQDNARKLLDEFADPACAFMVQFETRGWSIAANLDGKLLTFRASRVIPRVTAGNIALAIWRSIQYDDILRTFAPIVLDATPVYESETSCCSLVERIIQIEPTIAPKAIVMVDSMENQSHDGTQCWIIAVETCEDPCLIAYTTQTKAVETTAQQPLPAINPFAARNSSKCLDVVIAAKCFQLGPSGVLVQLAGSIHHDGTNMIPAKSHVDLVQYLVNMLPVYDDLQLLSKT